MNTYKHSCTAANAPKLLDWIKNRGGVAVWRSADLSAPGRSWSAPYLDKEGNPMGKQFWQAENSPSLIITDPSEIEVHEDAEVARFRVAVRRASGLAFKCTDASSRKINQAVEKAGKGAYYEFDYSSQEAVILAPVKSYPLSQHPTERTNETEPNIQKLQ